MQTEEIREFLKSKGLTNTSIRYILNAISEQEAIENARNSEEVKRGKDIMKFKPNPGKATLTQVGETQTFLGGDNHGLPIYKEDIDMIKRSGPLAKRLVEMNKTGEVNTYDKNTETLRTLRDTIDEVYPGDLNTGPDTTENIQEIRDSGDVMFGIDLETQGLQGDWKPGVGAVEKPFAGTEKPKELQMLKTQGMVKNNERVHDTSNVMRYFYPESQKVTDQEKAEIKRARGEEEDLPFPGYVDTNPYTYSNILKRMDDTHTRKNHDYGDAAYQGYKKYGDPYFLVQLHNKLSRLESLTVGKKTQQVKDESIDDTLLDMANYAVMYLESRHRDD